MITTKKITLSHKHAFRLQHLLDNRENRGWKRNGDVYIDDGKFCVDIFIESYVTIYTSITGVLSPYSSEKSTAIMPAKLKNDLSHINFLPNAVHNLVELLESMNAKLKVHSLWRYSFYGEKNKLSELFLRNGFKENHLHPEFFVGFKGKDGSKVYDLEFSISDNSSSNIVIDTKPISLSDNFKLHLVDPASGLSEVDVYEVKKLIDRNSS